MARLSVKPRTCDICGFDRLNVTDRVLSVHLRPTPKSDPVWVPVGTYGICAGCLSRRLQRKGLLPTSPNALTTGGTPPVERADVRERARRGRARVQSLTKSRARPPTRARREAVGR